MRLTAIEVPPMVTSGDPGFLKLAGVAAMLGANDAGKSRILRAIGDALDTRNAQRVDTEQPRFFVTLDESPGSWLEEERDHSGRREVRFLKHRAFFGRALVGDGFRVEVEAIDEAQARGIRDSVDQRLFVLRRWAGLAEEQWDALVGELRESPHAVISPVDGGWVFEWCLPAWDELTPRSRESLVRLGIEPEHHDRPIVATPLLPWVVELRGLPRVRFVPRRDPISDYGDFGIRCAPEDAPAAAEPGTWSLMVRRLFEKLTVARLPPFVTKQYDVSTDASGSSWFTRRESGTRLAPDEVADGFRVWVEIALIDASETLDDVVAQLSAILRDEADWPDADGAAAMHLHLIGHGRDLNAALAAEPEATVDLLAAIAPLLARERHAREARSYVGGTNDQPLTLVAGSGEQSGSLFLVDEPERHLHPKLQRRAAAWLQHVADEDLLFGQILFATHSISLMGLSGDVQYNEVRRPGSSTIVVPVALRQLDLLDSLSDELGLSRGELITLQRLFLFVEGAVDKMVLRELFPDQLRAAGIQVMAMHGTSRMQAIIESDLLFDSYSQPVAVIVDNIVQGELPPPDDIEALERLCGKRGARSGELRKAAELLKDAHHAGRRVRIEAIPTPDIIAELDAAVIRDVQGTDYPGYAVSRREWQERGRDGIGWKSFCVLQKWFRDGVEDIRPVAAEMRRRRIAPPELARLVAWAAELAAQADD